MSGHCSIAARGGPGWLQLIERDNAAPPSRPGLVIIVGPSRPSALLSRTPNV
jgi:hypothetical protein